MKLVNGMSVEGAAFQLLTVPALWASFPYPSLKKKQPAFFPCLNQEISENVEVLCGQGDVNK